MEMNSSEHSKSLSNRPAVPDIDENGKTNDKIVLDMRGHRCPIPMLAAKKALKTCAKRDLIELISTDPDSAKDIRLFAETAGVSLVSFSEENGIYRFCLRNSKT